MADRRAGKRQGPYVPSPGGGTEPRSRNKDGEWRTGSRSYALDVMDYSGTIDQDVDVTGDLVISGQMNGGVTVQGGARLRLTGQTNGDVFVLEGASLWQSGQLNGVLICQGWADITGQINGKVVVEGGVVLVAEGVQRNTNARHLVLDASGHWTRTEFPSVTRVTPDAPRWRWNQDGSMTLQPLG